MTYFKESETKCTCGCNTNEVDPRALDLLNELRGRYGKPIILNSAYRCENHPEEVNKPKPGYHNDGIAFDLRCTYREKIKLISLAEQIGFKGFGYRYETFLHIDARKQDYISAW